MYIDVSIALGYNYNPGYKYNPGTITLHVVKEIGFVRTINIKELCHHFFYPIL
jgi:hypothetical protein